MIKEEKIGLLAASIFPFILIWLYAGIFWVFLIVDVLIFAIAGSLFVVSILAYLSEKRNWSDEGSALIAFLIILPTMLTAYGYAIQQLMG